MVGEDNLNFSTNVSVSKREPKLLIGGQKVFFNEYGYLEEFENFRHIRERETENTSVGGHPLNSNRHVGLGGPMASFKYKATNFRHEFKQQISMFSDWSAILFPNLTLCLTVMKQQLCLV